MQLSSTNPFVKYSNTYCRLILILLCRNMIRLFKVKEKQRELAGNANGGAPIKKQSAGELRLHKGFSLLFSDALLFC